MSSTKASLNDTELTAVLNQQAARISWAELQPYFARGQVIVVQPGLDLITVGRELIRDNTATFKAWTDAEQVTGVSNEQAQIWYDQNAELWALVIAPWVLVQDRT
ncbi:DUF2288 domain-containing protein [Salinispirillum marinum]|uniref:DUF2288 domain-containing protein n=2 Tax=Saccharospirillaceae TaxID=255527 RepID=A0ABV8BCZ8_9GAMM